MHHAKWTMFKAEIENQIVTKYYCTENHAISINSFLLLFCFSIEILKLQINFIFTRFLVVDTEV